MPVSNFVTTVNGAQVSCSWDATLAYSFVYEDSKVVARLAAGVTSWTGQLVPGAVYQAQDSATASPDPAPENPMPARTLTLNWDNVSGAVKYEVSIDGFLSFVTANQTSYDYTSRRLSAGEKSITITAIDAAGNRSTTSALTIEIYDVPPPIEGLTLTQSGAGNISATIVPPSTW